MTQETEVTAVPPPNLVSAEREEEPEKVEIVEDIKVVKVVKDDETDEETAPEDARAGIYKRHGEKRDAEIAEQIEGKEQIDLDNDESSDILQAGDDRTSTPTDEDPLVEVVIFEHVRMVPQSKVEAAGGLQMYQMREAAYEQMRRNANRTTELDTRETALDDRDRQTPQPPAVPAMDQHKGQPPEDLPSDDQTLETIAGQFQEALLDDADNAPSLLTQMVKKAAAQAGNNFDEVGFRRQVTEDVLAGQRKVKVVKARAALIEANPVLDKNNSKFDHRLFQAVDDETAVVERHHKEWEPEQILAEAWKKVSKWKGSSLTETMTTKQKEKQELNRPSSGTQRFTQPLPEPRQTNSDYVAAERKRRGLEV